MPTYTSYCSSKAGLQHFTLAIAEEAKDYCDVMAVSPGAINTRMTGFLKWSFNNSFTSEPRDTSRNTFWDLSFER